MSKRPQSVREFQEAADGAAEPAASGSVAPGEPEFVAPVQGGPEMRYVHELPLALVVESPMNPRKRFDPAGLEELTASIREKGVLTPILVRPFGQLFEIGAGHRRYRAARAAGLEAVPAIVRDMTDTELLEVLVIENDQREDVHPLEEADGYRRLLMPGTGYDVARVAARIGRSEKYVYDRMKLLQLVPEAQRLFLEGKFEAGHAILLARLKPEDQAKVFGNRHQGRDSFFPGGLFEHEDLLFDPEEPAGGRATGESFKPVSVRELQGYIDTYIKLDIEAVDQMILPETAAALDAATEKAEKVVRITHDHAVYTKLSDAERKGIIGPMSWKRADGTKRGAKACEFAVTGLIAIGPGRGQAFRVCAAKEKCSTHWAERLRAKKQRAAATAKGGTSPQPARDRYAEEQRKRQAQNAREEAERNRWERARPAVLEALAAAVLKAPVKATGRLADLILDGLDSYQCRSKDIEKLVPRGQSAEDLVRHAAFIVVASQYDARGWRAAEEVPPIARAFNVDVRKILDQAAPEQTSAEAKSKKGGRR